MDHEKIYSAAVGWLIKYGPRILIAILILVVGEWIIRIIKGRLRHRLAKRKVQNAMVPFLQSFVIAILHVLLLLLVMQITGVQLTIFAAVIAAFGAAAGFALSGTLQNFASGILILLLRPFRIGDKIIAQGVEGTISSIQLFYTMMLTYDNRTVIFPNSKVSNEVIVNISLQDKRRYELELKFPNGVNFENIRTKILDSLLNDKDIIQDPKPEIAVTAIEGDSYKMQVHIWIKTKGFQSKRFVLNEKILSAVHASGEKIPGM